MVVFENVAVPKEAVAAMLAAVPMLGIIGRFLDSIMPDHGAPPKQRKTAIKLMSNATIRLLCLVVDLYNAVEFFHKWFRPEDLSEEWHKLSIINAAFYTSMLREFKAP
ncbi:hypothetical protein HDU86_006089 [Geranomyces michiganensis]|nr:hypothetical protein HDU86_006089 [Geranomyces michiganensis]